MRDQYRIDRWGEGYFEINSLGHVSVRLKHDQNAGDLFELMQTLVAQGIDPPILIRFNGILRDRINTLANAFQEAIQACRYRNTHRMVFPVKVNPHRHVVESVQIAGEAYQMGLEVGSKPELIAVLALEATPDTLLLCNGYKDAEYISLALMARRLGRRTIITIEQPYELKLVLEIADKLGVEAEIGFRMKLSSAGSGRWKSSGGEHSKFGLFSHEIMEGIELLQAQSKTHWVKLLHFHLGSQITAIEAIKKALKEATRIYTELAILLPALDFFDVGGGLAVDYDGSNSSADSSMNYTMQEYARDIVCSIGEACLAAGIDDPVIITESGRAILAHHSVLVTEVIDVTAIPNSMRAPPSQHPIVHNLLELAKNLSSENCRETFHDAIEIKERILEEFIYGKLSFQERAYAEQVVHQLIVNIRNHYELLLPDSRELERIDQILLETYFCNFSLFQSLPDAWAIEQLFPIMPIQRLHEKPTHRAVLADLTCDSDGKMDTFISEKGVEHFIKLHDYRGEPYYIGIFLIGAYQEILGGLHNLFGDTNVVHAELGEDGEWALSRLVEGDTIKEVLHYVQYNTEKLMTDLHTSIERSIKAGRISLAESAEIKKQFKQSLESYTYLVV